MQVLVQQPAERHHPLHPRQLNELDLTVRSRVGARAAALLLRDAEAQRRVCCRWLLGNQLSGTIPSTLSNLTSLNELCVASSRGSKGRGGSGVRCLGCAVCFCRYLYSNQLSGTIPFTLGSLTSWYFLCVPRGSVGARC